MTDHVGERPTVITLHRGGRDDRAIPPDIELHPYIDKLPGHTLSFGLAFEDCFPVGVGGCQWDLGLRDGIIDRGEVLLRQREHHLRPLALALD
jgi:hypothetical protein